MKQGQLAESPVAPASPSRRITMGHEALVRMAVGIRALGRLIRGCYGPKRRLAVSTRKMDTPVLLSDTQRICMDFGLEDPLQDLGAGMLKQAVDTVHAAAGDGAATVAILFDELVHDGLRHCVQGVEPRGMCRGMCDAAASVCEVLEALQFADIEAMHRVSALLRMAALGDELSTLLMQAFEALGADGIIHVKESRRAHSTFEISSDICADRGLATPLLTTDGLRARAVLARPYIFLTDKPMSCAGDVVGVLEQIGRLGGSLLIVAPSIEEGALASIVDWHLKERVQVAAINAPEYGDQRIETLHDYAALTGGMVYQAVGGHSVPIEYFGRAGEAIITKSSTVIREPVFHAGQVALRRAIIEQEAEDPRLSQHDRERRQIRLGNLRKQRGWIHLGAGNDVELGEQLEKTQRVLLAIRAAHGHGLVAGCGSALLQAAAKARSRSCLSDGERLGAAIMFRALAQPARQILRNAAVGEARVEEILGIYSNGGQVYDVEAGAWVNPLDAGIVDSCQALQCAVRTAASLSSAFLTSGGAVHRA
jgi:chaperonin GroEL